MAQKMRFVWMCIAAALVLLPAQQAVAVALLVGFVYMRIRGMNGLAMDET
jgi:hypothetical protein